MVADSGLMSDTNVTLLRQAGYKYILGARIRSEQKAVKDWIDTEIRKNRIHYAGRGVWLDWMTQGSRISENLFWNKDTHFYLSQKRLMFKFEPYQHGL